MSEAVVQVSELSRRFATTKALDSVSVLVNRGTVHGLVGANGAGKTTLIKHILGLLKAQSGAVRVFGLDPVKDPVAVLGRVGYLSEANDLPGWMRTDELIRYSRAFYSGWDDGYAEELRQTFGLDPSAKVGQLSKGQKARAGLLTALAYRPELLVLDEPSSGLDPMVRRDILTAVLRTIADEGRTVLFSSHLLDEVELVADHVTMIDGGRVALSGSLDSLLETHRHFTVRFEEAQARPPGDGEVLRWDGQDREWTALARCEPRKLEAAVAPSRGQIVAQRPASLDEVFVAHVGHSAAVSGEAS